MARWAEGSSQGPAGRNEGLLLQAPTIKGRTVVAEG